MGYTSSEQSTAKRSFWRTLADDVSANVIVISAAAMVPLMAMVGGGIDASRYYMAESRMQAACDAGALAGRRAMDDDAFSSEDRQIAENFFDQNYEDDLFGLEGKTRTYVGTQDGQVRGSASGTLPTSVMGAFGYDEFNIAVTCEADINIANTDIVFVLDVTGSMNCAPDNPGGGNCGNSPDPGAKIDGLRDAALTFYDVVEDATSDAAQVRYGIVPYSNSVNVGGSLNQAWLAPTATYQSREPNIELVPGDWEEVSQTIVSISVNYQDSSRDRRERSTAYPGSKAACDALKPADKVEFDDVLGEFNQQSQVVNGDFRTTTFNDTNEDILVYEGFANYRNSDGRCRYGWNIYKGNGDALWELLEERGEDQEVFQNWTYRPVEYDLADLYSNGSLVVPTGTNGTNETHTWNGCIEEANTVNTGTFSPIPAAANDLDINLVPDSADEFWKPAISSLIFYRYNSSGNWSRNEETTAAHWNGHPSQNCPKAARRLAEFNNRSELQAWLSEAEGFRARGNTYHDIGMIWGARFISPEGIFASDNATAPNGDAIQRHIIFMTDGLLVTSRTVHTPYGIEWWDRRVTDDGNNGTANARHAERFQAACRAARNNNISVWVVAFGTELTSNLENCATAGRAFQANDSAALEEKFQEIAERIAALRLTS